MIFDEPGRVTDRILMVGRREYCAYLLDGGGEYFLLGGAVAALAGEVMAQLEKWNVAAERITRIFILHAHFDHCGLVPFLKRRWPWARVTASARARTLLTTPKVVAAIGKLNRMLLEAEDRRQMLRNLVKRMEASAG